MQSTSNNNCWRQVDELKQHIKMLQAVGYNAMEGEDVSPHRDDGTGTEGTSARSLEALLLAKNRHLEHELTMARLQVADLTGSNMTYHSCLCTLISWPALALLHDLRS